jgi:MFS transporter, DHA1 family, inner membrane transport protein
MNKKERAIVFLLAGLNFTHILDFMIMMPLSNYLMPSTEVTSRFSLNINPHQFTMLVTAYSLSAVFSGICLASLVDRFDRKKVLVLVYIGFIIGTIACGLAPSYGTMLVARTVTGLFGGIIGGQVFSIISDLFSYERRGRAVGWVMSAFAIASIIGVPISLYLANLFNYDWHVPFLLIGGAAVFLLPVIIKVLPPLTGHITERREDQSRFDAYLKVFQNPSQGMALIFTMLMMIGHFLIIPFINPYMEFNRGYSKNQIPMVYLVGGFASLLSAIYLGRVADNVGKLRVFTFSVLFSFVMVFGITNMPAVPFAIVLPFFAIWFVFATSRGVTAQAMVTNVVEKEQQGSFMVLNSSMQHAGTSLASLIAGVVVTKDANGRIHGFEWLGYLSILVLLACLLLGRVLFQHMDKKSVPEVAVKEPNLKI